MTARPQWTGADAERLLLDDPDEAQRLLRGFHLLAGNGAAEEFEDTRVASIGRTRHLDTRRYSCGLHTVDRHMQRFMPSEFVLIGARQGQGKTAFAEKIALTNSNDHRVLFASLEVPRELLRDRMLAKLMRTSVQGVHDALRNDDDDYYLADGQLNLRDLHIWHPPSGKRTIQAIVKRAENLSAANLIIDYTRMLDGWDYGKESGRMINYVADWANDGGPTTFLITQLHKDAVGKRPNDGHIQDSQTIGQRADRILLLWRPFYGHPARDRIAEVIVAKNRYAGPVFRAHAHFTGPTMDFHPMSDEEEALAPCCQRKRKTEE